MDKVMGLTPVGMAGVQTVQGGKERECLNCCNEICPSEGKNLTFYEQIEKMSQIQRTFLKNIPQELSQLQSVVFTVVHPYLFIHTS